MRVLIVDDNQMALVIMRAALVKAGYEVVTVTDGEAALTILRQGTCRIVVSDWMMPGISGTELCHKVRTEHLAGYVYFILVTARDGAQERIEGLTAGADDFIAKPFDPNELVARVNAGQRILQADRAELQAEVSLRRLAEKDLVTHRQNLERANRNLESSNRKLSSLYQTAQRFVDNVSHEFRTPLTVIKGYAEAISEEMAGPVNEQQREFLGFVVDRTRDLAQMVDDLLDSSKIRAGTLRIDRAPLNVKRIFDSVRPMLLAKATGCGITLDERLPADLPMVFADAEKIGRVIVNLVINAIKFSPQHQCVTLWATQQLGGDVEIGVTDHGPGISPENVRLIFDRFKQFGDPQDAAKGFGLGLNIAHELVALNLGEIRVASVLGQGSTFSFTLPPNDPQIIVRRYLEYLDKSPDAGSMLAMMRVINSSGQHITDSLRAYIASTIRPTDLILCPHEGDAFIVIGRTTDTEQWIERLQAASQAFIARLGPNQNVLPPTFERLREWIYPIATEDARMYLLEQLHAEVVYA